MQSSSTTPETAELCRGSTRLDASPESTRQALGSQRRCEAQQPRPIHSGHFRSTLHSRLRGRINFGSESGDRASPPRPNGSDSVSTSYFSVGGVCSANCCMKRKTVDQTSSAARVVARLEVDRREREHDRLGSVRSQGSGTDGTWRFSGAGWGPTPSASPGSGTASAG